MKALLFAAGLGTRLKPWTDFHPKALAPVGGKPMLGRVIEKLKGYGIREFVVNVHHFADQIADYLRQQDNFGTDIILSDESDMLLDTGGGLLYAGRLLGDSEHVLIHNADILTDFDLGAMQSQACASGAIATLLVKERRTQRYLAFDSAGLMRGWRNLPPDKYVPTEPILTVAACGHSVAFILCRLKYSTFWPDTTNPCKAKKPAGIHLTVCASSQ